MDTRELEQKAADLFRIASLPDMADVLHRDSIVAVWNGRQGRFESVIIRAHKTNRTIPSQSMKVNVRFYAGQPTDAESVRKHVAETLAKASKSKKVTPLKK